LATNEVGDSEWSQIWKFTTAPVPAPLPDVPELDSPSDNAVDISIEPVLSWESSDNTATYRVQVSIYDDFSSTTYDQNGITSTSTTVSGLSNGTTYFWRVRATNPAGFSAWSEVKQFSTLQAPPPPLNPPLLGSPGNNSLDVSINSELSWNSSQGAISYGVQVSEYEDFAIMAFEQTGVTGTSTTVEGLSSSKFYYWRVIATNSFGNSDWSDVWAFTTALPEPVPAETPQLIS